MAVIKYKKFFYLLSSILILASIAMFWQYPAPASIEFTGGSLLEVTYENKVPLVNDIADVFSGEAFKDVQSLRGVTVQKIEDKNFLLRFGPADEELHQKILSSLSGAKEIRFETIGPAIGEELKRKTLWALGAAILGMFFYVGVVFRKVGREVRSWKMSLMAIIALAHDIIIMSGVYMIFAHFYGFEVGLVFITALLTIWGYSINDTIVVFDRIRENLLKEGKKDAEEIFGMSISQTIGRSINTSLAVFILLLALALVGPTPLLPFILPLLVGVVVGTYSSIFIATPLLSEKLGKGY